MCLAAMKTGLSSSQSDTLAEMLALVKSCGPPVALTSRDSAIELKQSVSCINCNVSEVISNESYICIASAAFLAIGMLSN